MATKIIPDARIRARRDGEPPSGDYVLYWMQQAQRARHNEALELAIQRANDLECPLAVAFCVVPDYPDASARHYHFMLQGLADVASDLHRRGIAFEALRGRPAEVIPDLARKARLLVLDRGHLPVQTAWRRDVIDAVDIPVVEVEADVVVPVDLVSDGLEYAARTIRPKIERHLDDMVYELRTTPLAQAAVGGEGADLSLARRTSHPRVDLSDLDRAVRELGVPAEPGPVESWTGGSSRAQAGLRRFLDAVLPSYGDMRNRFDLEHSSSELSPYLHYGQISVVEVAHRARTSGAPAAEVEAFIDEVVVRRELAMNYVHHCAAHDRFGGLPDWARDTLYAHRDDERPQVLTAEELEHGETDDEVWNTIMKVIRERGWVHNQLRMYWGKQILRWTNTPEHAFRTLLELNNRYFLDGRDANSYANVAWCFGRHDQPFQERDIIGKTRPFTDAALRRKGDLDAWVDAHR